MPEVDHLHCARAELADHQRELVAFDPQAVVDCRALTRADAEIALRVLPDVERRIVISSVDVYRAFGASTTNARPTLCRWTKTLPRGRIGTPTGACSLAWTTMT